MVTIDGDGCKRNRKLQSDAAQQEYILFQILTRLPIKSLLRFKLACKSWASLISDPFFINSHSHRNKPDPPEIITMKVVEENYVVLMDVKGRHKSALIPLIRTEDRNLRFSPSPAIIHHGGLFLIGIKGRRLMVCNPATREVAALPPATYIPNVLPSGAGIGLDPSTNMYKVVRMFLRQENYNSPQPRLPIYGIEVITLGAVGNSWRQKEYLLDIVFADVNAVTVRGAAYWTTFNKNDRFSKMSILRFDLSNEEFAAIDPPDPDKSLQLVELQGHLCCYGTTLLHSHTPTVWVWLSNDNLVGWILRYTIHFQELLQLQGHWGFMPIAIDQEGCLLFTFKLHMHRYDPRTNQFYEMGSDAYAPEITDSCCWCHTTSYVETIMPISSDQ